MIRRSIGLAAVATALLPFSSCTCRDSAPEPPPKVAAAPGGFGAIVTPRKLPERRPDLNTGKVEAPTLEARPAPTPPPKKDQTTIPDNFPEGIPVPKGSSVMAVQNLANGANNVVFGTEGTASELFQMYKGSMEKSGWGAPTQQYESKEQSFLTFKRGNTITNISVTKDPRTGKRVVAVMYYEEKPLPFPEF